MAGIAKKLQIKVGNKILVLNSPSGYLDFIDLPANAIIETTPLGSYDVIQWFVNDKAQARSEAPEVIALQSANTVFWACYPKKSSILKSDISRYNGWGSLVDAGYQGVASISIDDNWSGVRFRKQKDVKHKSQSTSDKSVEAKTGKIWKDWFAELNRNGGKKLSHKELVAFLSAQHKIDSWWCQMITNTYEQHIGRREKHQMGGSFEISVSKTIAVSIDVLYQSWFEPEKRKLWLRDVEIEISKATENRSIRAKWVDGETRISLEFYKKGDSKSQIVVQHMKLESREAAEDQKLYWKDQLMQLVSFLS